MRLLLKLRPRQRPASSNLLNCTLQDPDHALSLRDMQGCGKIFGCEYFKLETCVTNADGENDTTLATLTPHSVNAGAGIPVQTILRYVAED